MALPTTTTRSSTMTSPTPTIHTTEETHKEAVTSSVGHCRTSHDGTAPSIHSLKGEPNTQLVKDNRAAPAGVSAQAPIEVSKWRFAFITASLMFSIFLFALDQLILSVAIPKITSEFGQLNSLPWLANAFFLTLLGFNLMYAQWQQIFPSKSVILFATGVFEIGSLLCGLAPGMVVLILGRAITGVGASGIFSGAMLIVAELVPLHNRAQYFGIFGVCFAVASVAGPLIGGAFTDHVSWRWCFYINLPFGGIALALIAAFQPMSPPMGRAASYKGWNREMIWAALRCDWGGVAISMAWAVCLILFLQWGGIERSWKDGGVITCIVLSVVLIPIFLGYEYWLGEKAMFKMRLFKRRTIAGACFLLANIFAVFMLSVYYISVAFQAIYNTSATGAGIRLLPFIMVQIVILIASSRIIPLIGRYKYVITAGPVFLAIGSGLLYTLKYGTPITHLMGFQVFLGIGIGLSLQNTLVAVQHALKSEPWLISAGTGLAVFLGFGGRILGLSLAGSVFSNMLKKNLHKYAPTLPKEYVEAVIGRADAVWKIIPDADRPEVLKAYMETIRLVLLLGVPFSILGFFGGLWIKNSKMASKEEEMAAIQKIKEKAALDAQETKDLEDAAIAGREERIAEDITAVAPQVTVSDAQALIAKHEGKSVV